MKTLRLKYENHAAFEKACKKYGWVTESGTYEDPDTVVVLLPKEEAEYILVNVLCKNDNIPAGLESKDITEQIDSPMHTFLGISN